MTSVAFAMSDDGRQRVTLRRRSTNSATATSRAADDALQHVLDRRLRRKEGRPPPVSRRELGVVSAAVRGSVDRYGLPQWLLRVAVLAGVAVVIGGGVVTLARRGSASHSVAGTVLVGKTPLGQATISFQRAAADVGDEPVSLTTGKDGNFQSLEDKPLPAGLYTVVVTKVAGEKPGRPAAIPAMYRDPATSPLRVMVTENLSGLKLLIRR